MRSTNQEIRNLLRLLRHPHALERERLAVMLREATKAEDARSALHHVIAKAFDSSNLSDRLRLEIVQRCDIDGETTRSVAAALGVSLRQFFRIRSEAIAAIAQSVERELANASDSCTDLLKLAQILETIDAKAALEIYRHLPVGVREETAYNIVRTSIWAGFDVTQEQIDACEGPWKLLALAAVARNLVSRGDDAGAQRTRDRLREELKGLKGTRYDGVAFELAFLDRCDASRRGDLVESRALLHDLRSLAGQNETRQALALLFDADQASTEGDLAAATLAIDHVERLEVHERDLSVMARIAWAKATLSHVREFFGEAYALANGACLSTATWEGAFSWRAAGLAGRAALFCDEFWSPPNILEEKYPDVWSRAAAEGVRARHLLRNAPERSREAAQFALDLTARHHCPAYLAYAQVSLAGALDALGEGERAQKLRVAAWEAAVRLNDQFTLYDLFYQPHAVTHDLGNMIADEQFANAVSRYLEGALPAYAALRQGRSGQSIRAIAQYCLQLGIGVDPSVDLEAAVQPLAQGLLRGNDDALVLRAQSGEIGRVSARALSWLLPPHERGSFEQRFLGAWNQGVESARTLICPTAQVWEEAV